LNPKHSTKGSVNTRKYLLDIQICNLGSRFNTNDTLQQRQQYTQRPAQGQNPTDILITILLRLVYSKIVCQLQQRYLAKGFCTAEFDLLSIVQLCGEKRECRVFYAIQCRSL